MLLCHPPVFLQLTTQIARISANEVEWCFNSRADIGYADITMNRISSPVKSKLMSGWRNRFGRFLFALARVAFLGRRLHDPSVSEG